MTVTSVGRPKLATPGAQRFAQEGQLFRGPVAGLEVLVIPLRMPVVAGRPGGHADTLAHGTAAAIRSGASFGTLSVGMCKVADMALEFPLPQARHHLDELVARAHQDHERIVLTEHGKPTAVLISVAELDELQYAQDQADIALCEAIKAKDEPGLPHEAFMAVLDAEDSGQPAG